MEEYKVGMIGDWTSVAGFMAVGVQALVVEEPERGPAVWESLDLERFAVIMVTEPVYEVLRSDPVFSAHEGLPVIVAVPAVTGSMGIARESIKRKMEKALGAVID